MTKFENKIENKRTNFVGNIGKENVRHKVVKQNFGKN
jgi:hypothetical protein